jgi:cellulose synthase operon protein YhjQ
MGSRSTGVDDQPAADSTPEDVAALYSWANLQGAKYRDYSASRREHRAQVRYRAAKSLLERELKAQMEAEASAAEAERAAAASADSSFVAIEDSQSSSVVLQEAARKASAERVEAARRAETAARAAVLALREEREIAEAHSSARRQALIYEQAEFRRQQLAGPQPHGYAGAENPIEGPGDITSDAPQDLQQFLFSGWQEAYGYGRGLPYAKDSQKTEANDVNLRVDNESDSDYEAGTNAPAWLFPSLMPQRAQAPQSIAQVHHGDSRAVATLQDSRERVASRWFALKGVFDDPALGLPAMQTARLGGTSTHVLAVFSLAGGVGKTSLVATLGRALVSQGEKVALADTTAHGLLPIYFGSHQTGPGVVRTLAQRPDSKDGPISMVIHDVGGEGQDQRQREVLAEAILRSAEQRHRLLVDVSSATGRVIQRLANVNPIVLVPMAPDMNSVISLQAVERQFRAIVDHEGWPLLPFYVLNKFDASLALHLDVREVLRRQIGDRLLPVAIRRSPAVSEALAEGMTVLDYAPEAPVSQDYRDVASWLRSVAPAAERFQSMRRVGQ